MWKLWGEMETKDLIKNLIENLKRDEDKLEHRINTSLSVHDHDFLGWRLYQLRNFKTMLIKMKNQTFNNREFVISEPATMFNTNTVGDMESPMFKILRED